MSTSISVQRNNLVGSIQKSLLYMDVTEGALVLYKKNLALTGKLCLSPQTLNAKRSRPSETSLNVKFSA